MSFWERSLYGKSCSMWPEEPFAPSILISSCLDLEKQKNTLINAPGYGTKMEQFWGNISCNEMAEWQMENEKSDCLNTPARGIAMHCGAGSWLVTKWSVQPITAKDAMISKNTYTVCGLPMYTRQVYLRVIDGNPLIKLWTGCDEVDVLYVSFSWPWSCLSVSDT